GGDRGFWSDVGHGLVSSPKPSPPLAPPLPQGEEGKDRDLAPKGHNLNSLGRQPQVEERRKIPSPVGAAFCEMQHAAPSGLELVGGSQYLGLAPQAIQITPLQGWTTLHGSASGFGACARAPWALQISRISPSSRIATAVFAFWKIAFTRPGVASMPRSWSQ